MKIPSQKETPGFSIYIDHGIGTKTPGQYYLGDAFPKGEPMKVQEVLQALSRIETILLEKYGKEELYRIVMNPLIPKLNLTVEEYTKMEAGDPRFNEKQDVMELLDRIKEYRSHHKADL